MPNARSINIRHIERSAGNIETSMQHIQEVILSYAESSNYYTERNEPIPVEYLSTCAILDMLMDGLDTIKTNLEELSKTL